MAGALWCADALFAFAKAGAVGFHFHWGFGGQPKIGGQPNTGVQTNFYNLTGPDGVYKYGGPYPSVHAPWYSYLLFRRATAGKSNGFSDARITNVINSPNDCKANMKVWSLLADDGSLRVAILNKDAWTPCNVVVNLEARYCSGQGELSRMMPGRRGMDSKSGVTWQNQTYDATDKGQRVNGQIVERVTPKWGNNGKCQMTVPMPVASGAVLEVAPKGIARLLTNERLNASGSVQAAAAMSGAAVPPGAAGPDAPAGAAPKSSSSASAPRPASMFSALGRRITG
jgi:hypothetical protein